MNPAQHRGPLGARLVRLHRGQRKFAGSQYGYGPNFYPYYDSAFGESYDGPTEIILETAAPAAPVALAKPLESLVMELRGDRWVRLTSYGAQEIGASSPNAPFPSASTRDTAAATVPVPAAAPAALARTQPPVDLPPAALVFRDGHTEQVANYTIVANILTIKTDFWSTGSWTRTVPLSSLDLPATLELNRARGARFSLPSRPGEVMMRP